MEFKVGDRVESVTGVGGRHVVGVRGTIIGIDDEMYAVKFDEHICGHGFSGYDELDCKDGYGWWCLEYRLKLIEENDQNTPQSINKYEFNIGDRVRAIKGVGMSRVVGVEGTVVCFYEEGSLDMQYGVEFDKPINGHELNSDEGVIDCKENCGWYCTEDKLELIKFKFKVGDRVVSVKEVGYRKMIDVKGTVIYIDKSDDDQTYAVEFDDIINGIYLGSYNNNCEVGKGWWVRESEIELFNTDERVDKETNSTQTQEADNEKSLKSLLIAGRIVEIACYGEKRIGVVECNEEIIRTAHGFHRVPDFDDNLAHTIMNDQSITRIYENTEEGLKLIWDRKEHINVDWTKVEIDTKIQVKCIENSDWANRCFAKYEDGKVYAFNNGGSSFTCEDHEIIAWEFARLYEEEMQ